MFYYIALVVKTKILLIFILSTFWFLAFSQNRGNSSLEEQRIEELEFIDRLPEFIPKNEKYRYSEFRDGYVFYVSRKQSNVTKLNFNRYRSLISMIDEKGDTTFVANFEIIKYILIDKDLYYHDRDKGYFEIRTNPTDSVRLCVQRQLNIVNREVLKDHEKPTSSSTDKSFSVIYVPRNPTLPREKITVSRDDIFYLIEGSNELLIANKSSFFKLFPSRKGQIENYLSKQAKQRTPVKFHKEEDLKKLLSFCLGLS